MGSNDGQPIAFAWIHVLFFLVQGVYTCTNKVVSLANALCRFISISISVLSKVIDPSNSSFDDLQLIGNVSYNLMPTDFRSSWKIPSSPGMTCFFCWLCFCRLLSLFYFFHPPIHLIFILPIHFVSFLWFLGVSINQNGRRCQGC